MKRILCVILHYGDEAETWRCVNSIKQQTQMDIVVADNDPAQLLEVPASLIPTVRLFRTGGEDGFARGNNRAVAACTTTDYDAVLLLNNDTVVCGDAVFRLRRLLDQPGVGMVGPCMPYLHDSSRVWACGGRIKRRTLEIFGLQNIRQKEPYDTDYLPGAVILCRMALWSELGGLPEKYFLAYEEAEFALKIRRLGYRVMVDPQAEVLHAVGMSSDKRPQFLYNTMRNRLKFGKFLWSYPGFAYAICVTFLFCLNKTAGLRLWYSAVKDEIMNVPIDRNKLAAVAQRFHA